jgi:glycogen debranching enzyme
MNLQLTGSDLPDAAAAQYAVAASASLQERRPRTLKHGDMFGVFDPRGDILPGEGSPDGLYWRDTRYLSQLDFSLGGAPPMLLSSNLRDDNLTLTCDLTNPDLFANGAVVLARDLIHIRRSKLVWNAGCFERLAFHNFSERTQTLPVVVRFAADFADLFEVRGSRRVRHGEHHPAEIAGDGVTLAYTGLDGRPRTTRLRFDPAPERLEVGRATFRLVLAPQQHVVLYVETVCDQPSPARPPREAFLIAVRDARRALRNRSARAAAIATSNGIFNEAIRRSVADLYMLITDKPEGPYPYAGIPWFSAAFGRDAIITAMQMLWVDPEIARGVLSYLAANQATAIDPGADAEPGKILHEVRHGEMAELGEVPFRRYYGSIDSTPLFVMLAGAYHERTGDIATIRRLWPSILAALGWIDRYGDRDGDGFVEYGRLSPDGLLNQGWKDSQDSISHADGRLATGPIALCEVQGYVYAARLAAARLAEHLLEPAMALDLEARAAALQQRFEAAFWCSDLDTYALALDGDKNPCRVLTSNAGHALTTGIADPDRAAQVAAQLMGSRMFSGWGIRTLGAGEARYNPMSYHNGSVWPHDNALIALGLGRYGMRQAAARLFEALFDASIYIELRRLPELFCGFQRRRGQGPTGYPVACSPQAWAAATPLALLQACLGIGFDPAEHTILFERPTLPRFLDEVVLRGLSVGGGRADVMLRRVGEEVAMNVLARSGRVRVVMVS